MLAITMIVIIGKETDTLVKRLPGNWHMTHSQDVITSDFSAARQSSHQP